jgi:hypothetical protein
MKNWVRREPKNAQSIVNGIYRNKNGLIGPPVIYTTPVTMDGSREISMMEISFEVKRK